MYVSRYRRLVKCRLLYRNLNIKHNYGLLRNFVQTLLGMLYLQLRTQCIEK